MASKHRRSLRLSGYDYSKPGAYFVTICVQGRECLLGHVIDGEMHLNEYGRILFNCWNDLQYHYSNVELDSFVVMPNHVHGIIMIVGAIFKPGPTIQPLTEIVRAFKTFSARKINNIRSMSGLTVWQRGFYEHVIRDEPSLQRIRDYIATNPLRWELDRENPRRQGNDDFDLWLTKFKTKPRDFNGKL